MFKKLIGKSYYLVILAVIWIVIQLVQGINLLVLKETATYYNFIVNLFYNGVYAIMIYLVAFYLLDKFYKKIDVTFITHFSYIAIITAILNVITVIF